MKYYRLIIEPIAPLGTALISGTLWGHLAWAVRYLEGEEALNEWLKKQESLPWLVSSAMPEGMLPRPLLRPMARPKDKPALEELQKAKKTKKMPYIQENVFLYLRDRLNETSLNEALKANLQQSSDKKDEKTSERSQIAKNRIDRLSGRTPDSGGLYFIEAEFYYKASLQIFIGMQEDEKKLLQRLLDYISSCGFGADASIGHGAFKYQLLEETALFAKAGTRCMSLSHGVITQEMTEPFYKLHTHFGKLGGHFVLGAYSPFKYPVLMAKPGATFNATEQGAFCGKILAQVHHELQEIRHYAVHLPIMFTEVSS